MTKFEAALSAWIAFHSELGVNIEATFMPPATESDLVAAEQSIGFSIPDDLRALYKVANGQYDTYDHAHTLQDRLAPDEYWAPLFGYYRLLPLEYAVSRHLGELESRKAHYGFIEKYNEANPQEPYNEAHDSWDIRDGDSVDPRGWNPSWFIFADGNADSIAIDMNPPHGGVPGQIVEFGADVARLSVLGSSITDLMEVASYRLTPDETNRYQRNEADDEDVGKVFFDIDWRNKPYDEQEYLDSIPVFPQEYQQWQEELQKRADLRSQRFVDWLKQKGLDDSDVSELALMQRSELGYTVDFEPMPDHVFQAMDAWSISRGDGPMLDTPEPDDATLHPIIWNRYLISLAQQVIASTEEHGEYVSSTNRYGLLRRDAIDLINRYYIESNEWSPRQYKSATKFAHRIARLDIVKKGEGSSYSMNVEGTLLRICFTIYDPDTYKSEDHCDKVDLNKYPFD